MARIGLVRGAGTGGELIEVFKHVCREVVSYLGIRDAIVFHEFPGIFSSYATLSRHSLEDQRRIVHEEAETLFDLYKRFRQEGGKFVFRTAVNAETLYRFRARALSVKMLYESEGLSVLRDQTQGFYANGEYRVRPEEIVFQGGFSLENFRELMQWLEHAWPSPPSEVVMVYKIHLFDGVLEEMMRRAGQAVSIRFLPVDVIWEYLEKFRKQAPSSHVVLVLGNEIGDVMQEPVFRMFTGLTWKEAYFKNFFLHGDLRGIVEFQTGHGSADDIAGKGIVDPSATILSALSILEEAFSVAGLRETGHQVLKRTKELYRKKQRKLRTDEFVEDMLSALREALSQSREMQGERTEQAK